jgi:hypothetical protein
MDKKLKKTALIALFMTFASFCTLGQTVYLYKFDDEVLGTFDGTVTNSAVENESANISGTGGKWEYIDGYNNLALLFDTNASTDAKISGVNFDFGQKFVLEAKIMTKDFLSQTSANINLVKTADGSTLKWYLTQDGKLHFDVNNGTAYSFTSTVSVMPDASSEEQWTNLYTVVDLSKSDKNDVVKMYMTRSGSSPLSYTSDITNSSYTIKSCEFNATCAAVHAFDNNNSSLWSSLSNPGSGGVFIGQDFGEGVAKHIRWISIKNYQSQQTVSSFKVQRSNDNSTWTDVSTLSLPQDAETHTFLLPESSSARYWRFLANSSTGTGYWVICESEMKETSISVPLDSGSSNLPSGGITLSPASNAVEMLERNSNAFTLKTDFVKVTANASFTSFDPDDFEGDVATNYFAPTVSSSIELDPRRFIRRVVNSPSDFENGQLISSETTVSYDTHPNPVSAFHGIFELSFQLDKSTYEGTVVVDILIKKPEDSAFKKIGEVQTVNPVSGDWNVKYYWNSRETNFDWTETDAGPYETTGPVKFKLNVR